MAYYLADGIYLSYPTFVTSIRLPQSEPDKLFAKNQEGYRKDIEHAFGVSHAQFKIICDQPARMWRVLKPLYMVLFDVVDSYCFDWFKI